MNKISSTLERQVLREISPGQSRCWLLSPVPGHPTPRCFVAPIFRLTTPVPWHRFAFVCLCLLAIKWLLRLITVTVIIIFLIPNSAVPHNKWCLFHYKEVAKQSVSEYSFTVLRELICRGSRLYPADKFICNPLKYSTMWLPEIKEPPLKYISTTHTEWC